MLHRYWKALRLMEFGDGGTFNFADAIQETQTTQTTQETTSDIPEVTDRVLANAAKKEVKTVDEAENKALDEADKPFVDELTKLKQEAEKKVLDEQYGLETLLGGTDLGNQLSATPENRENLKNIQEAIDVYVAKEIVEVAGPKMSKIIATHIVHTLLDLCQTSGDVTELINAMKQFGGGSFIQETLKTTKKQIENGLNGLVSLFGAKATTAVDKNPFGRFEQLFDLIRDNEKHLTAIDPHTKGKKHFLEQSAVLADPNSFADFLNSPRFAQEIAGGNGQTSENRQEEIHDLFGIQEGVPPNPQATAEAFETLGNKVDEKGNKIFEKIDPVQLSAAMANLANAQGKTDVEKKAFLAQGATAFGVLDGLMKGAGPMLSELGITSTNAYEFLTDPDSTVGSILNMALKFFGFKGGVDDLASTYYESKRQSEYPKQALQASNIIQAYAMKYDINISQAYSIASTQKVSNVQDFYPDMPHSEKGLSASILAAKESLTTGGMSVGFLQSLAKSPLLSAEERAKISECVFVDTKTKESFIKQEKLIEHFDMIAAVTPGFVFKSINTDMTIRKDKAHLPAIIAEMMTSPRDTKDIALYLKTRSGPSEADQKVQEELTGKLGQINPPSYTPQGPDKKEQKADDGSQEGDLEGEGDEEEGDVEDGQQADDGSNGNIDIDSVDDSFPSESEIIALCSKENAPNNEEKIKDIGFRYMVKKCGFSPELAIAILGNIKYESGFQTNIVGDNGTSFGICQWHKTRREGLKNFAISNNMSVGSFYAQLKYIKYELEQPAFASAKAQIDKVSSPEAKAQMFCQHYEIPAQMTMQKYMRGQEAIKTHNMLKGKYGISLKDIEEKRKVKNQEAIGFNEKILAKSLDQFGGVGDSITYGMKLMKKFNLESPSLEVGGERIDKVLMNFTRMEGSLDKKETPSFFVMAGYNHDLANPADRQLAINGIVDIAKRLQTKGIQPVLCQLYHVDPAKEAHKNPSLNDRNNIDAFNKELYDAAARQLTGQPAPYVVDFRKVFENQSMALHQGATEKILTGFTDPNYRSTGSEQVA